jgi:hypothetical protein
MLKQLLIALFSLAALHAEEPVLPPEAKALLPDAGFRFFAVPPKVKAFGTFPVRAFAMV